MKISLAFIVALFLYGCSIQQIAEKPTPKRLQSTDGGLIVRLAPNMADRQRFYRWSNSLAVTRIAHGPNGTTEQFYVAQVKAGTSRSVVYADALPPGIYRIDELPPPNGLCGPTVCSYSHVSIQQSIGQFEIKAGQLTDLGLIVESMASPRDMNVAVVHDSAVDHPETAELVRIVAPNLVPLLEEPMLSWLSDAEMTNMPQAFAAVRAASFGIQSPKDAGDGVVIYGSSNGVLYSWSQAEHRVGHYIGSAVTVEATLVARDGRWLAGGEMGVLQISADRGRSWSSLKRNLPSGVIIDLNQWRDQIIVTEVLDGSAFIYTSNLASSEDWKKISQFSLDSTREAEIEGAVPQSFVVGDVLVVAFPGNHIAQIDLNSGEVAAYALPGYLSSVDVSLDGVLYCRCTGFVGFRSYESRDLGKTWQPSKWPRGVLFPTFNLDGRHGVGAELAVLFGTKLVYTNDAGSSWMDSVSAPGFISHLFYNHDGTAAYATLGNADIWKTSDDGKTWERLPP